MSDGKGKQSLMDGAVVPRMQKITEEIQEKKTSETQSRCASDQNKSQKVEKDNSGTEASTK